MKKRTLAALLSMVMAVGVLAGCGSSNTTTTTDAAATESDDAATAVSEAATEAAEEDEENYETGDAALDDTRNQDGIGEQELLVVSFGTSYNDSRRLTIGAIESAIAEACPDYSVRRGFTSQIIIDHVKSRDNVTIDNVTEALDRAVDNGVKTLVVQPTHLMNGLEYTDLENEIAQYADAFEQVSIGEPLLTSDEDFQAVAQAIVDATAEYDDGKTAICFMGHGTEAASNQVYAQMQTVLTDMGCENYYVGTVEATPSLDDVLALVEAGDYERVVLEPLMVVAGDHANNDMAGDEPDSWKSTFEAAGYEVVPLVRGLGELEAIQDLYVQHAQAAIDALPSSQVATAAEMTTVEDVVEEGMTPVYASSLKDGTYDVEMKSSSSMFKVDRCELVVEDGSMQALLYMTSQSYLYLYAGTATEAAAADESDYILREDAGDDMGSYSLPIEALDEGISCAAFSKKKEKWYDRTLLFRADSLPADAFLEARGTRVSDLQLEDGTYTIDVTLAGGSGRASIESPATLVVDRIHDGDTYIVTLTWSSPNYDYMIVDGIQYDPVNTEGNSTFEIPLPTLDTPIAVQADTTAMSQPHLIDYTLTFDSASITAAK